MKPFTKYWDGDTNDKFSDRKTVHRQAESLPYLIGCESIVDLGCGTGRLVEHFQDHGVDDAWGVTYQKREYEAALAKGLNVLYEDIHELSFPDDRFDGMVCWDCLEHCVSPYIALCEARRIVKPGGRGVIFIPGQFWTNFKYHIIVPTIRQMVHLLELSGWKLDQLLDYSPADDQMAIYLIYNPTD